MSNANRLELADLKSLPAWQKYTIITLIVMLAVSFLISGAMLVFVETMTKSKPEVGKIGGATVEAQKFSHYASAFRSLQSRAELFPKIVFRDPLFQSPQPDPSTAEFLQLVRSAKGVTLPYLVARRMEVKDGRADLESRRDEIVGTLVWMHLLLYPMAKDAGFSVPQVMASKIARDVSLPPATPITATNPTDVGKQEEIQNKQRESEYAAHVRQLGLSVDEYEAIVAEMLTVKEYVEQRIKAAGQVPLQDVLPPFLASKQQYAMEYLRVPTFNPAESATLPYAAGALPAGVPKEWQGRISLDVAAKTVTIRGLMTAEGAEALRAADFDPAWQAVVAQAAQALSPWHPEIDRRAREKLAADRARERARRMLAAVTAASGELLFPDPVAAFAEGRIKQEGGSGENNYHEVQYELSVILARYRDLEPNVAIDFDKIQRYYNHYKDTLFKLPLTDEQIAAKVAAERAELTKQLEDAAKANQPGGAQSRPATQPSVVAPPEGWTNWEERRKTALKYRQLNEVADEIRAQISRDGARAMARDVFKAVQKSLDSRIANNATARAHAETLERSRWDNARSLYEIYFGTPEQPEVGLNFNARVATLRADLLARWAEFRNNAGLGDDPAPSQGADVTGQIAGRHYQVSLENFDRMIEVVWQQFASRAQLGVMPLEKPDNALAALESTLDTIRRQLAQEKTTSSKIESSRAIERLAITEAGLVRRIKEFNELREALLNFRRFTADVLTQNMAWAASNADGNIPRIWLEDSALRLRDALLAGLDRASAMGQLAQKADAAKRDWQAAEDSWRAFQAEKSNQNNLLKELPPSALMGVTPDGFPLPLNQLGLELLTFRKEASFRGAFYHGIHGAGVPGFNVQGGYTPQELDRLPAMLREIPAWKLARQWNLDSDQQGADSVAAVLRRLEVGQYSATLGVEDFGLFLVLINAKSRVATPTAAEVDAKAAEDHLDSVRAEVAREFANDLRRQLADRAAELQGLDAGTLAGKLESAAADIVRYQLAGPASGPDTPYSDAALRALIGLLRGQAADMVAFSAVPQGSRLERAAVEARALLLGHAFAVAAEKYQLPYRRAGGKGAWIGLEDSVGDIALQSWNKKSVAQSCLTLAPFTDAGPVLGEIYPALPDSGDDGTRPAHLIIRALGVKAAAADSVKFSEINEQRLAGIRAVLEVRRAATNPEIQRLLDLKSLQDYYANQRKQPVEIYSLKVLETSRSDPN